MDWNKAKTLLILTFLILNAYLAIQLIERTTEPRLVSSTTSTVASVLKERKIDEKTLPNASKEIGYLTGEIDTSSLKPDEASGLSGAVTSIRNKVEWNIRLANPYALDTKAMRQSATKFVQENVKHGAEYSFWKYDKTRDEMTFVQTYRGQPLYSTSAEERGTEDMIGPSLLVIQLSDGKVISYNQRHLTEIVRQNQDVTLLSASEAIVQLSENGHFPPSRKLTRIELGYFCLATDGTQAVQILPPTWLIELDSEVFFVNAIDGGVQTIEQLDAVSKK
ncbi:two-component system regulatory protein YycI [Exiguobacterium flavidum]|uniref:two-component system regulatory protein YycI n=1 Tax=Exiguobacterium flavidum TaxID=2184695 RepID=UPI000DF7D48F|nr:two-component system regulatory protein YycI [Exiguobacterium flavidum]